MPRQPSTPGTAVVDHGVVVGDKSGAGDGVGVVVEVGVIVGVGVRDGVALGVTGVIGLGDINASTGYMFSMAVRHSRPPLRTNLLKRAAW